MEDNNTEFTAKRDEFEALMPGGYADGDDIFSPETWTGSEETAEDTQTEQADDDFTLEKFLTNETNTDAKPEADGSEEVTTTDNGEQAAKKLKFTARIDHADKDVEVDEEDLPTMYAKAYATERAQKRLGEIQPHYDRLEGIARRMGYNSAAEFMDEVEKSDKASRVEKLTSEGVHPLMAEDYVNRSYGNQPQPQQTQQPQQTPAAPQRDFKAEAMELMGEYPELRGKEFPNEVVKDAVSSGKSLLTVYNAYRNKQKAAENAALKKENDVLKQNAHAAERAPVRGVSKGGKTDTKSSDPFIAGFNSDNW